MDSESLWGPIPDTAPSVTPLGILREQGRILGELTDGAVQGRIEWSRKPSWRGKSEEAAFHFILTAPMVNHVVLLFTIIYCHESENPPAMYPVHIIIRADNIFDVSSLQMTKEGIYSGIESIICNSGDELKDAFRTLFHSGGLLEVIRELVSQSKGTTAKPLPGEGSDE